MTSNTHGHFIISLDFELFWGMRDKCSLEEYQENILGARKAIPQMLALFEKYQVGATFATVGFLFCDSLEELREHLPKETPSYTNPLFSPYTAAIDRLGTNEKEDPYHFAGSLLREIASHPQHEIASHTFSHYYCLEAGQTKEQFQADLQSAVKIAASKNISLRSMVFPRNQYNENYLDLCHALGITHYRGNPKSWLYDAREENSESQIRRLLRLIDSYFNISGHHTYPLEHPSESPINVPASRFLRPYSRRLFFLEGLKIRRIKKSMTAAAQRKQCYHLWWHPHNFGTNTPENLRQLEEILKHYAVLHEKYGMTNITMKDF